MKRERLLEFCEGSIRYFMYDLMYLYNETYLDYLDDIYVENYDNYITDQTFVDTFNLPIIDEDNPYFYERKAKVLGNILQYLVQQHGINIAIEDIFWHETYNPREEGIGPSCYLKVSPNQEQKVIDLIEHTQVLYGLNTLYTHGPVTYKIITKPVLPFTSVINHMLQYIDQDIHLKNSLLHMDIEVFYDEITPYLTLDFNTPKRFNEILPFITRLLGTHAFKMDDNIHLKARYNETYDKISLTFTYFLPLICEKLGVSGDAFIGCMDKAFIPYYADEPIHTMLDKEEALIVTYFTSDGEENMYAPAMVHCKYTPIV